MFDSPIFSFLIAYFLGAIPFGLLLTRAAGLGDIRAIGSGNIGATNVLRTGNKKLALLTLLLDAAKGYVAVALLHPAAALGVVLGHVFSPFLKFKGGKGVATLFGVAFALQPMVGLCCAITWLGVFALTRISSLSALIMLLFFGGSLAYFHPSLWLIAIALPVLIASKHHENIRRLRSGTEPRFTSGEKK